VICRGMEVQRNRDSCRLNYDGGRLSTWEPKAENYWSKIVKQKLCFGQDSGRNWQSMTWSLRDVFVAGLN